MKRLILAIAAAGLLGAASWAQACSLTAWSGTFGTPIVGGPEPAEPDVKRFAGRCAMKVDADEGVYTTLPNDEATMITSFAFRTQNGPGPANLMVAFSDDARTPGNEIFTVSTDGTSVTVTPNDGGSPASSTLSAGQFTAGFWVVVQVQWTAGGAINLYLNADPLNGDPADATGASGDANSRVSAVEFGAPGGTGGFEIELDQFVSQRNNFVAADCVGDANGDGMINVGDASLAVAERLGNNIADGAPDCNRDGTINVGDASCMVAIRLGPTGGVCP